MKQLLLFSVLSIFCLKISAQTNTWVGNNGYWETAGNWSLNLVPNQNHDVIIPTGSTVLLNVDGYTKSITLQGNAIFNFIDTSSLKLSFTNASSFSAASNFNWSGGTITGGGTLTLNGTTVITPENTYYVKRIEGNTTIINNGIILQQGSADFIIKDGTIINRASGVIDLQVEGADIVRHANPLTNLIINEGTIKRTGTGRVDIEIGFENNGGTISVEGGTLRINGLSNNFTDGIYNVATGSLMEWRGDFLLAGTLTGVLNGDIQCGDGALCSFNIPVGTTANFNFSGNANMFWKAGAQMGGGTLVNSGKIYIKPNNNWKIIENSTFTNSGLINIGGSTGSDLRIEDGTLINQAGGIIDLQADSADILIPSGSTTNMFINEGLIKRTGTGRAEISPEFHNNNGTISVEGGTLRFSGLPKYMTDGFYNVSMGGLMEWRTDIVCAGILTGSLEGDILCGAGTSYCRLNVPNGNSATLNFTGNANLFFNAGYQEGGGTLVNSGKIFIAPTNNWKIQENSTLSNLGLINIGGSTGSDLRIEDGTLINQVGGVIDGKQIAQIFLLLAQAYII